MKLLAKTNRYYLLFTPLLLLLGSVVIFLVVRFQMYDDIDERLLYQKRIVLEELSNGRIPGAGKLLEVTTINPSEQIKLSYSDTVFYEPDEAEYIPYRQLIFSETIDSINFVIAIRNSPGEIEPLVLSITLSLTLVFLGMLLAANYLSGTINQKIWSPFNVTLNRIRHFDLTQKKALSLEESDIDEFNELNQVLKTMSARLNKDYSSLKEFAENAAHEMQTPLAIIRSKIELLMQSSGLSEKQSELLLSSSEAAGRLSRLSTSLLLLTKIENRQFHNPEPVDLNSLVKKMLVDLEEFIIFRQLSSELTKEGHCIQTMNATLAEIMVSNLLQNAIRYAHSPSTISIRTTSELLEVRNNGKQLPFDSAKLFQRFQKGTGSSQSLGLGLAIVQEICDTYAFKCSYCYDGTDHKFQILFKK
ncbi:MAG: sensor histidine kinase [Calditrichia bacterium]